MGIRVLVALDLKGKREGQLLVSSGEDSMKLAAFIECSFGWGTQPV